MQKNGQGSIFLVTFKYDCGQLVYKGREESTKENFIHNKWMFIFCVGNLNLEAKGNTTLCFW